jgi:hypothetical protein
MMAELPKIVSILGGSTVTTDVNEKELDKEWLDLMIEARKLGISIEEIKEFLNKNCLKA